MPLPVPRIRRKRVLPAIRRGDEYLLVARERSGRQALRGLLV